MRSHDLPNASKQIYHLLSERGMTLDELQIAMPKWTPATVDRGVSRLLRRGAICDTNLRRPTRSGRLGVIFAARPANIDNLTSLGARLKTPKGKCATDWYREVERIHAERGGSIDAIRKAAGMSMHTYRCLRDIVLLSERDDLDVEHKAIVAEAMKTVDEDRRLLAAYNMVKPIAELIFGHKGNRNGSDIKRSEAFDHAIRVLADTCATEIKMPYLSGKQIDSAVQQLKEAQQSLGRLIRQIRRRKPARMSNGRISSSPEA